MNRETEATTDPGLRVEEELERRRRAETLPRRCALSPPEAFSADPAPPEAIERLCAGIDPAETGRKARTVAGRIGMPASSVRLQTEVRSKPSPASVPWLRRHGAGH